MKKQSLPLTHYAVGGMTKCFKLPYNPLMRTSWHLHRYISTFLLLMGSLCLFAQGNLFEHYGEKDGLTDNKVYDIVIGSDGMIWLATEKGISRFNGLTFNEVDKQTDFGEEKVLGLFQDAQRNTWCYTASSQIFKYEDGSFSGIAANEKLPGIVNSRIINMAVFDNQKNIWISTVIGGGLYKITNGYASVEEVVLEQEVTGSYFVKAVDDENYICGSRKSAGQNNILSIISSDVSTINLSGEQAYSKSGLIQLRDGSMLYSKGQEIINFRGGTVIARVFVEKSVERMFQDSEGKIWIALYQGGVICYPAGNINSGATGTYSYFGNKTVLGVTEDRTGNIWFGTATDGVYQMPLRPVLKYTSPKVYTKTNDNSEEIVNPIVINSGRDLGGIGLSFDPKVISTDTTRYDTIPPTIYISGLSIRDLDTTVQKYYDLPHDFNYLKINYAGFAVGNPEAMQYKYKMEGVDPKWVYTSNTFVQYTTLPPGEYTFEVNTMNKHGVWGKETATITFNIRPPFYYTWWFILAGSIVVIGGSVFGMRYWSKRVKKRERERSALNQQIAEIELQALRAQMNPHFIFNTLSSIQHFITINDAEAALRYLSKFAKLMRSIMENSKKPVIPIKDEINALELYLQLESMRFKGKFEYEIVVNDSIDVDQDEIPSMLIQPYVENAILHGITNKDGTGNIQVSVDKEGKHIVCTVDDDGIGRQEAQKLKQSGKHKSRGLSITGERLSILNASQGGNLDVEIIDKKDTEGNAIGTTVRVFVPIDRAGLQSKTIQP